MGGGGSAAPAEQAQEPAVSYLSEYEPGYLSWLRLVGCCCVVADEFYRLVSKG